MRPKTVLPLILGLGLVGRLAIAWLPMEALIVHVLPDDAFIYFVIARNLGAGLGATFDGTTPTNGFHPLWALVITPIFARWPSGDLPVHLALSLSAGMDVVTIGLIFVAARRLSGDERAGLVSAALYAFNPLLAIASINGLETSLGLLLLMVCFHAFLRLTFTDGDRTPAADSQSGRGGLGPSVLLRGRGSSVHGGGRPASGPAGATSSRRPRPSAGSRRAIAFGLAGGAMMLARSDLGLIFVMLCALLAFASDRLSRPGSRAIHRLRAPAVAVTAAGLTLLPWLAWSQWRVGTFVQSSAVAIPLLAQSRIRAGLSGWAGFEYLWADFLSPVLLFLLRVGLMYPGVAVLAVLAALLVRRVRSLGGRTESGVAPREWGIRIGEWAIAIGGLVIVIVHTLVRWYPRGWYFAPLALGVSLAAGSVSVRAIQSLTARRVRAVWAWALGVGLASVVVVQAFKIGREPAYPWQRQMLDGARWLAAHTPDEAVVGSFNAGIFAYFSGRTVINLDGLTDWNAVHAWQAGRLLDYLESRGGEFLIDFDNYLWHSYGPYLGPSAGDRLKRIASIATDEGALGDLSIYMLADGQ